MNSKKRPLNTVRRVFLCVVLCIFACSCVHCTNPEVQRDPIQAKFFEVVEYSLSEEVPESLIITDDRIIGSFFEYSQEYTESYRRYVQDSSLSSKHAGPSDANGNPIYPDSRLRIYDLKGQLLKDLNMNEELAPTDCQRIIINNPINGFCVFSTYVDFLSFETTYQLAFFDKDGTLLKTVELFPNEYIENIQSVCIAENGDVYIAGWGVDYIDKVYVFRSTGRLKQSIEMEPVTLPDLIMIDGNIYLHASVVREGQYQEVLFSLETDSETIREPIIIPEGYPIECPVIAVGNACYSYDRQKLVEYSLETNTIREIVSWSDTNISTSVTAAWILPDQKIICAGLSSATGLTTISVLTGTNEDPMLGQEEIIVAGLGLNEDKDIQALVYRFNNKHEDYRITLRDYEDEIVDGLSWQQMIPKIRRIMLLDMFSNNSPDIYLDIDGNLSLIDYANKDYLLELTSTIESSMFLTEENYILDIVHNARSVQGTYFIPTCFSVNCFSGLPETIQGKKSWTIDEFNDMVAELPENTPVQSAFTKEDLLFWTLQASMKEYVDFDRLTTNFKGNNFIQLLEWVDRYGIESSSLEITSDLEAALKFEYIDSMGAVMDAYQYYGQPLEYIGFPGNKSDGLVYYPRYIFAISSQTTNVAECWDFIADALSEEFQKTHFPYANPVNRNAVQYRIDMVLEDIEESDPNLFTDEVLSNASKTYWDILERADQMLIRSDTVSAVVLEESAAYFAGYKTASEVAELIQNRIQNMINERQ